MSEETISEALLPGMKVRLKENARPYVKIREWQFQGMEKTKILLVHKEKGYILEVDPGEIEIA